MNKNPLGASQRRPRMTVISLALAAAVTLQGLPAVAPSFAPVAQAAQVPTSADWNPKNIIDADGFNYGTIRGEGDLNRLPSSIWGFAQFADRATMESDDQWSVWRDTSLPEGTPIYMRYEKSDGTMSRIHKAVTHSLTIRGTEGLVYSFRFMEGQPNIKHDNFKDGSADIQLMIGEGNVAKNSQIGENYAAVRLAPGGNYYGGNIEDSREINWFHHTRNGGQVTWGETLIKVYQVSPAATVLRNRVEDTPSKAIRRSYSGRVWIDTMRATTSENNWGSNYNRNADNGVVFDGGYDKTAAGYTVYQAVPNNEAYQFLNNLRKNTQNKWDFRRSNSTMLSRQRQMADYVRNHPENFTVYKATTDSSGHYTLNTSFDQPQHADYVYMWVEGSDGIKTNMSAWTTPEFRNPFGADHFQFPDAHGWKSRDDRHRNGHVPYQTHLGANHSEAPKYDPAGNWTNVDFALAGTPGGGSHTVTPINPPTPKPSATPTSTPPTTSVSPTPTATTTSVVTNTKTSTVTNTKTSTVTSTATTSTTPEPTPVTTTPGSGPDKPGSSDPTCITSAAGFVVPLLMLLPLALLTQIRLPGLEAFQNQVNSTIERANTDLQRSLGLFDERTATMVRDLFGQRLPIREFLTALLALTAAGLSIAIADQAAKDCIDGYDGLSSDADKEGSAKPEKLMSKDSK